MIDKESVKAQTDIVALIGQYVKLKKQGSSYIGLCPFHDERTPSFNVTPSKGIFKCFGCGESGDVFQFIMKYHKIDFKQALDFLAKENGLNIDTYSTTSEPYKIPTPSVLRAKEPQPTGVFIEWSLLEKSLSHYDNNNFVKYLKSKFSEGTVKELIERFKIGTSKRWNGANVFWYIDDNSKIPYGKIMLYDSITGKREKQYNNSVHNLLNLPKPSHCLYGLHQVTTEPKGKTIAIVESEKTAIIMTAFFPSFVWMATNSLSLIKLEPLAGRNMVLFPDTGKYNDWSKVGNEASTKGFNIVVSDYLERLNLEKNNDLEDIAKMGNWFEQYQKPPEPKAKPLSKDEKILKDMVTQQPLITDMIQRLGLVSVRTLKQINFNV